MPYLFTLYTAIFLGVLLIATGTLFAAWPRRRAPGGRALFLMTVAVWIWLAAGLLEASATGLPGKILWSKFAYLGAHTGSPLFLLFVLAYTHRTRWLTPRHIALLFTLPALTISFAATNEWHHLIWTGFTIAPVGPNMYIYLHGPWFWVAIFYINAVLVTATALLLWFVFSSRELYRDQAVGLVVSVSFPWIGFATYLIANPFPGLDLTALSFAFTEAILVFTFQRLSFLDVVPVAREVLVESMTDGVLVLDPHGRIVDLNAAARRLLDPGGFQRLIGQPAGAALVSHPGLLASLAAGRAGEWGVAD